MSLPSTPISIKPSASEIQNGSLSQKNLEIAIRALAQDGLVLLEDLIPHSTLDKLNKKMVQDAYTLQSRKDSPFNYHKGNIQQDPPLTKEYFSADIFTSTFTPHTLPITSQVFTHSLTHTPRPNRNPPHLHRPRPPPLPALHLRQHRLPPFAHRPSSLPTNPQRRRLRPPPHPLRPRRKRAPRRHASAQRVHRSLARHARLHYARRPGRRARRPRQRAYQGRAARCAPRRAPAVPARGPQGQCGCKRFAPVAWGETQFERRGEGHACV